MNTLLLICVILLWVCVLFLGFLLLGALRALGLLSWRLEQLEATTPKRLGRDGLKPGKKAPDFTLPSVGSKEVSLHDFASSRTRGRIARGPKSGHEGRVASTRRARGEPRIVISSRRRRRLRHRPA
jgi:hypothetical protein